jgi:WS/DGAT/MGAT family acyltransferase
LSSIEAIMWRTGHDATLRMAVGSLMILDHLPEREAVIARLDAAARQAPRLRWRLDDPTGTRTRPGWVEVPDFSAARHVRSMAVGSPGDRRQLLELVGLLEPAPFDPDRGPWDVTLIEGLEGGKAALYMRAHHVLTDGQGGLSMMALIVDESMPPPPPVEVATEDVLAEPLADALASVPDVPAGDAPRKRKPGTVSINIDLTSAAAPVAQGVAAGVSFAKTINPLEVLVRSVQWGLDMASSVSHQVVVTGGRLSPIPPSGAMTSRFEVLSIPDAREAARALGGSRNDLLIAAASAGLGLYHEKVGAPCYELRLALPTTQHRNTGAYGGNWVAPTRVEVPTSAEHPGPHFGIVAERIAKARREPVMRVASGVASVVGRLPTRVLTPALHAQASSVDFVATAVPGFRTDRHVGGALIEECFPFGPRLGCLANISALANGDRLDIGIAVDPHAIPDSDLLVDCLAQAFRAYAPEPDVVPERRRPSRTSS